MASLGRIPQYCVAAYVAIALIRIAAARLDGIHLVAAIGSIVTVMGAWPTITVFRKREKPAKYDGDGDSATTDDEKT
jgi:hypothetical protein